MMTMIIKPNDFISYLDELFPNARCELNYSEDYELAIAVMLSAQTTDIATNKVTSVLFSHYPTLNMLYNANICDIEKDIKSIGLYKHKANHIVGIAHDLVERFNGNLPSDKNLLTTLPGIGNKSAGVIRAEIFNIPDFPVDTHILRISKRLGFRNNTDDPFKTEIKLKEIFPENQWIKLHHQIIFFGRYFCTAKNPCCKKCKICKYCKEYQGFSK